MKTKTTFRSIAIFAFLCLLFVEPAISQNMRKHFCGSDLLKAAMASAQKEFGHQATFPGRTVAVRSLLKNGMETAAYRSDTLFMYSIYGGYNDGANEKILNSYNTDGQLIETLTKVWIIDSWADNNSVINEYDADGNLVTETRQLFRSNTWIDNSMFTYTYDASGNCLTILEQGWNGTDWNNYNYSTFTYDGSGNLLTELYQQWDGETWMDSELDNNSYDASGNLLTKLGQGWDGEAWFNMYLNTWTYDGNGNRLTALEQGWDGEGWMNYTFITWTYDENNNPLSVVLASCYDGETWEDESRSDWTYDATGNALTFTMSMVDWNSGGWMEYSKTAYSYEDGIITANSQIWYSATSAWTIGDAYFTVKYYDNGTVTEFFNGGPAVRVKVYYSSANVGIKEPAENQSGNFTIYPNPANSSVTIIPADPAVRIEQIRLIDLSGKEQPLFMTNNQVDISKLQNGIYFLNLTTSEGLTEVKKFMKQ